MTAGTLSTRISARRWLRLLMATCLALTGLVALSVVTVATAPAAGAATEVPCTSGTGKSFSMTAKKISDGAALYSQDWPGGTVPVDVGPPGSTTCWVNVSRPSKWIGGRGDTLDYDHWKVSPVPGASGSGLYDANLATVSNPNCTATWAVGAVVNNRPSCSAWVIDGSQSASTAAMTFGWTANPVLTVKKPSQVGTGGVTSTVINSVQGINCGADCVQQYPKNTVLTLTAKADPGSRFTGWLNAPGCNGTTPCQVTMSADLEVQAVFAPESGFQLAVANYGLGSGTITSNSGDIDCPGVCADTYPENAPITLTATPDPGSHFAGWLSDCAAAGMNSHCTVTMTSDKNASAIFEPDPVPTMLSVSKNGTGGGVVTSTPAGIDCGGTCAHEFDSGTAVSLSAVPDPGSIFSGWSSGGCAGMGACDVSLQTPTEVFATFTTKAYQPDGLVGIGGGAQAGQGVYNTTGKKQAKATKVKRGKSVSFSWTVENDGNVTDAVKLKAASNSLGGFKVKYLVGSTDVTKKVNAGKYSKKLTAGAAVTVKAKVTVLKSADKQSTKKLLLLATSKTDGAKRDAVRASVTAK